MDCKDAHRMKIVQLNDNLILRSVGDILQYFHIFQLRAVVLLSPSRVVARDAVLDIVHEVVLVTEVIFFQIEVAERIVSIGRR